MLDAVIALTRDLRAAGVDASSAEAIDGIRAVEQVGVGERLLVRAALQATLVKRAEDLGVFELLFDRHFPPAPLLPPTGRVDDEVAPGGAGAEVAPGSLGAAGELPLALVDAVRHGDDEALVYLAEEAVARYSGIETQVGSERYFLYRVMRALDLSNLLIAVMASQRSEHPDSSEFELRQLRDEVRQRIDRLRRLLAAAIRSRLALRTGWPGSAPLRYPGGWRTSTCSPPRRPSSTTCVPPSGRSPASWPVGSAGSVAAIVTAVSTCGARCAGRWTPGASRSTRPGAGRGGRSRNW